jgi:hypothetical protein
VKLYHMLSTESQRLRRMPRTTSILEERLEIACLEMLPCSCKLDDYRGRLRCGVSGPFRLPWTSLDWVRLS